MIQKNKISSEIECDQLSMIPTSKLLNLVEQTCTEQEFKNFYKKENPIFTSSGINDDWTFNKENVPPGVWRYVYINSKEYAQHHSYYEIDISNLYKTKPIRVLDFGSGAQANIIDPINDYFLLDINKEVVSRLLIKYNDYKNVTIFSSLEEAFRSNIKFDVVISHEAIEHVRFINEHLQLLYRLCENNGYFDISFPLDNACGGHVVDLYEDTKLKYPYTLMRM